MSMPQRNVRRVRTQAGAQHYDQRVGEVIRPKGSVEAKEKWDTRKWQAAAGGMFVLIILGELLVGVSEIAIAITVVILLGLNWFIRELTKPRAAATGRKRTTTTRHVVRRRGPARKTVRRR